MSKHKISIEKVREIIGKRIRKQRRMLDITQKQLGEKIGVVPSFVCEMEKGQKAIHMEMLYKLEVEIGPLWGNFHE